MAEEKLGRRIPFYNEIPWVPGPPRGWKDDVVETNDKDGKAKRVRMAYEVAAGDKDDVVEANYPPQSGSGEVPLPPGLPFPRELLGRGASHPPAASEPFLPGALG